MKTIDEKNIERLLKDTKTLLIATDNGIGINGGLTQILGAFSLMVNQMKKGGMSEDLLRYAFNVGINDNPENEEKEIDEKTKKAKEELKKSLLDLTKALTKDLEEMLGDE